MLWVLISNYKNGFTGKLKCSCGSNYNRVNARGRYCWKCYERIHGDCTAPILPEAELEDAVLRACRILHGKKLDFNVATIPELDEQSTADELTHAAVIHM